MTTSVSKTTPQSAPRDAQSLMKIGIFQLRMLIEACGGLANNEEKMAFAKMSVDEKVQLAMQLLAKWDQANGGGAPMNGAGGHAMPAPMQMMPAPQGMQVDPATIAAAAQAAAPQAPAPTTRKPRNSAANNAAATEAAPGTDLGVDVVNLLNRLVTQNDEMIATHVTSTKEILGQLSEANKTNAENTTNYKAVYGALTMMNQQLQAVQFQAKLSMALSLALAEQVLGAPRDAIIGAAIGDVETIGQVLAQASNPGKG